MTTAPSIRRLESDIVAIDVEQPTGLVRGCTWRGAGIDLFRQLRGGIPGYIGGLRIYDEHDERWYDDRRDMFATTGFAAGDRDVAVTRRYAGAPFDVRLRLALEDDVLHWEVEAVKREAAAADRSLRVHFLLPLIAGWEVWAPCAWGEQTFDGMTPFEFMYTQVPYVSRQEVILPMVSHFSRRLDVGYSLVEPIEANVPAAKFVFNNGDRCFNWGSMRKDIRTVPMLEAVNYYIGLVGDRPMRTKAMVFFHEGDWRPALGRVYRRWRPFFDPFNEAIHERSGVFECGGVENADRIETMKAMGVKTLEVHGHFQDYGDYHQEGRDSWHAIGAKEAFFRLGQGRVTPADVEEFFATRSDEEIAAAIRPAAPPGAGEERLPAVRHHRADIRRRLQLLADAGISCHWYFNYTDGYRPPAEARWPDSISRDEDGEPIPSGWHMCHNMNADPRWSFGRHLIASARRIVDDYPMLDGFFLDCFRHFEIDFAHDDGVTVVHGKPCYNMNHSYDEIERIIKTGILGPRKMTSFANKPMSIRSMRYCDGQLLEGNGEQYEEKFFWASIACPLFFMWTRHDAPLDEFLRRAVLHGCHPRNAEPTAENIALYRRYLPLFAAFARRVFCFEPDPLRVPRGSRGKLYTLPDAGYVAGIVNLHVADGDSVRWGRCPHALFRVRRGWDVTRAGVLHPGDADWRPAPFKFDGTFIAVPMPAYVNCAVVKLFVGSDSRRSIGPERFHERARMCEDPESAFEDLASR